MATESKLEAVVKDQRLNAALSWLLVTFVSIAVLAGVLGGDVLWAGFAASVAALALLPTVVYRDPTVMLPWEVLAIAAFPILGRAFATVPVTSQLTAYLSVAALALIVAVELHVFTPVRMTHWFAILFVVIATMAAAGVWAVIQWLSDIYLGTAFITNEQVLMWDFVAATAAGLLAGVLFELYFRRITPIEPRLPGELGRGQ